MSYFLVLPSSALPYIHTWRDILFSAMDRCRFTQSMSGVSSGSPRTNLSASSRRARLHSGETAIEEQLRRIDEIDALDAPLAAAGLESIREHRGRALTVLEDVRYLPAAIGDEKRQDQSYGRCLSAWGFYHD